MRGAVFVTGGSGFLGAALVARLRSDGREVVAPSSGALDLARDWDEDLVPAGVDVLVHCAASRARSDPGPERFVEEVRLNVDATARLYDVARRRGIAHVVHVSTLAVFQDAPRPDALLDEGSPRVVAPAHPYALTKLWGEELALSLRGAFETLAVVRPASVYGPGQPARAYLARIAERARRGSRETITLPPPDGHTVAPVFLDDVVDVLAESVRRPRSLVVNVAGPDALPERRIVEDVAAIFGARPHVETSREEARSDAASTAHVDALFPGRVVTRWRDGLARTWTVD
jgi:nucleoside-diphosphate-sugar epimerase